MGWTLRKLVQSGQNQPIRGESLGVLTNERARCTNGNYGWISDNIPSYPPLANINIQHCLDSGKTLQLPRSLGHWASIKLGGAHKSGR